MCPGKLSNDTVSPTKIREMEDISYEEKLGVLGTFSLEKRSFGLI